MDNNVLVSIIVPVYNIQEYIVECLKSILNQSFNDIEIIVVNDGSTDYSLKYVKDLSINNDKITIISGENEGLSAARNKGLKVSKGEYIYFCDGDDYISKYTIEKCIDLIKKYTADIVVFEAETVGNTYKADKEHYYFFEKIGVDDETVINGLDFYKRYYKRINIINTPLMFIKKNFLLTNKLMFTEGLLYEDIDFYNKIINKNPKLVLSRAKLYFRRYRENSIVTSDVEYKNIHSYIYIIHQMMTQTTCDLIKEFTYVGIGLLEYTLRMAIDNQIRLNNKDIEKVKEILFFVRVEYIQKSVKTLLCLYSIEGILPFDGSSFYNRIELKRLLRRLMDSLREELGYDEEKIGIYGTGKWAQVFVDSYKEVYKQKQVDFVYLDSFESSGTRWKHGVICNVDEIDLTTLKSILVISYKNEKEILDKLKKRKFTGTVIGLFGALDKT